MNPALVSRRSALRGLSGGLALAAGAFAPPSTFAQSSSAGLRLKNTGLEHFGLTVPDSEAAARFYGRIFDTQLFKEKDPPPRFYVRLGISYLAFGQHPETAPFIDHFCALTEGYERGAARKAMEDAGITFGSGALGMAADPDGLKFQILAVPGGLAGTIVAGPRISQEEPLFQAIATDHLVLHVSHLEASAAHYKKIFGPELPRTKKPDRVWFQLARTRLALEQVSAGEKPSIHHLSIRVAGFDPKAAAAKLRQAKVEVTSSTAQAVMFKDLNGIEMEIQGHA
ncbi:MAG TPA: VOC family protein [Bryobacteraceae bacterium]|jgi:catechol 2,3-dioxygenase-like lactoylglutathione lyase family enzyme